MVLKRIQTRQIALTACPDRQRAMSDINWSAIYSHRRSSARVLSNRMKHLVNLPSSVFPGVRLSFLFPSVVDI